MAIASAANVSPGVGRVDSNLGVGRGLSVMSTIVRPGAAAGVWTAHPCEGPRVGLKAGRRISCSVRRMFLKDHRGPLRPHRRVWNTGPIPEFESGS